MHQNNNDAKAPPSTSRPVLITALPVEPRLAERAHPLISVGFTPGTMRCVRFPDSIEELTNLLSDDRTTAFVDIGSLTTSDEIAKLAAVQRTATSPFYVYNRDQRHLVYVIPGEDPRVIPMRWTARGE